MKKIKILYWAITCLFSAFMLFSAWPDLVKNPGAVAFITELGYPEYFVQFIGIAKVLGVIAILVPGFPIIKEWAYAGLFFDLFGAGFSLIMKQGWHPQLLVLLVPMAFLFASHYLYHRLNDKTIRNENSRTV